MKVVALDYGSVRTGVAVSDPTGTLARPVAVVERVRTKAGLERLVELIRAEHAERVVVGLPLTLRGERGEQAVETEEFVDALRRALDVPGEVLAAATDDASLVEAAGGSVCVVEAPPENIKVTRPVDLEVAAALLRARGS
jgi:putative Holliday junction resolvase